MDLLLRQLQASGLGLSISNSYARGFLHADDVRTLATSRASLKAQATLVEKFAEQNFLNLNADKCEVVAFSMSHRDDYPLCTVGGSPANQGH